MLIDLICHYGRHDPSLPFKVQLHDFPLRHLIADAAEGYRVHELMRLQQPGDVWTYLWVEFLDVPGSVHSYREWRKKENPKSGLWPENWIPLMEFDRCFHWAWDDTDPESSCWLTEREGDRFKVLAKQLFKQVQEAQHAVRHCEDVLIQVELARLDDLSHPADLKARVFELTRADYKSPTSPKFSPSFYEKLQSLMALPEVTSFSSCDDDYQLVRLAMRQQRLRTTKGPLEQADVWPISILSDRLHGPEEWNALFLRYSEGLGFGYLTVTPPWERTMNQQGLFRWLLHHQDAGEFPGYRRTVGDGWCFYEDLMSEEAFAKQSEFWRNLLAVRLKVKV